MKPKNKEEKFVVAAIGGNQSVVVHLWKAKLKDLQKNILLLGWTSHHRCDVHVTSKAINQRVGKSMKVPCIPPFARTSIKELKKHVSDIYFCSVYLMQFWKKRFSFLPTVQSTIYDMETNTP